MELVKRGMTPDFTFMILTLGLRMGNLLDGQRRCRSDGVNRHVLLVRIEP